MNFVKLTRTSGEEILVSSLHIVAIEESTRVRRYTIVHMTGATIHVKEDADDILYVLDAFISVTG